IGPITGALWLSLRAQRETAPPSVVPRRRSGGRRSFSRTGPARGSHLDWVLLRKGGAKALDPQCDLERRSDRSPRYRDDQALVEMHHTLLNAQRALAQAAQRRRQLVEQLGPAAVILTGKLDPNPLRLGLGGGQFAFVDGTLEEEPRGDLHKARGQAHAFGRIGDRGRAGKVAGLLPSRSVEVSGGLLDQRHTFPEQVLERPRGGKAVNERNRDRGRRGCSETASRSFGLA